MIPPVHESSSLLDSEDGFDANSVTYPHEVCLLLPVVKYESLKMN